MKAHDWHTEVEGTGDTVCRRCGAVYHRCSGGAERAVIEAAKALFDRYRAEDQAEGAWKGDYTLDSNLHFLFLKVEALQEARDE